MKANYTIHNTMQYNGNVSQIIQYNTKKNCNVTNGNTFYNTCTMATSLYGGIFLLRGTIGVGVLSQRLNEYAKL